mmetsp:Transcript_66042/g.123181  ORF Transcript_66042/g.123181 Transcript_66042/m.123181 type:complete len:410 (-) Transcript_66042:41-1270(-)
MAGLQGSELPGVVDDEAEDPTERKAVAQQEDGRGLDVLCAYRSTKVVRIRDRYLGFVYWGIVFLVLMYIIIFAFLIEGKHQLREPGFGTTITKLSGKAFVDGRAMDITDLRHPTADPSGAFVMTKRVTMPNQTQGLCVNWDDPRTCPCEGSETCVDNFCQTQSWCPSIGMHNADPPPQGAIVEKVEGLKYIKLFVHAGISFASRDHFFVYGNSEDSSYQEEQTQFSNITIEEVLAECDPPLQVEDLLDTGALIGISFLWSCNVLSPCEPSIVVKRLDSGQGYVKQRAHRHRGSDGIEQRDAVYMYGIRFLVDSTGIGRRASLVLIVIQIGSALALLSTASMTADYMMTSKLYGKDRRAAYYKCKVKETRDFSDLKDRLNLVEDAREMGDATLLVQSQAAGGTTVRQRGR